MFLFIIDKVRTNIYFKLKSVNSILVDVYTFRTFVITKTVNLNKTIIYFVSVSIILTKSIKYSSFNVVNLNEETVFEYQYIHVLYR